MKIRYREDDHGPQTTSPAAKIRRCCARARAYAPPRRAQRVYARRVAAQGTPRALRRATIVTLMRPCSFLLPPSPPALPVHPVSSCHVLFPLQCAHTQQHGLREGRELTEKKTETEHIGSGNKRKMSRDMLEHEEPHRAKYMACSSEGRVERRQWVHTRTGMHREKKRVRK